MIIPKFKKTNHIVRFVLIAFGSIVVILGLGTEIIDIMAIYFGINVPPMIALLIIAYIQYAIIIALDDDSVFDKIEPPEESFPINILHNLIGGRATFILMLLFMCLLSIVSEIPGLGEHVFYGNTSVLQHIRFTNKIFISIVVTFVSLYTAHFDHMQIAKKSDL